MHTREVSASNLFAEKKIRKLKFFILKNKGDSKVFLYLCREIKIILTNFNN